MATIFSGTASNLLAKPSKLVDAPYLNARMRIAGDFVQDTGLSEVGDIMMFFPVPVDAIICHVEIGALPVPGGTWNIDLFHEPNLGEAPSLYAAGAFGTSVTIPSSPGLGGYRYRDRTMSTGNLPLWQIPFVEGEKPKDAVLWFGLTNLTESTASPAIRMEIHYLVD